MGASGICHQRHRDRAERCRRHRSEPLLLFTILEAQSLKNAYYPEPQRGFAQTLQRSQNALLGNMQDNLSLEFVPDMERFLRKRMPAGVKRLEQHIPFRRLWEPAAFAQDFPTTK
jgi:hypothetical protein